MATIHTLRAETKSGELARKDQFAWKIAEFAAQAKDVELDADVINMIINRVIDNGAIALAAANEYPIQVAREKALVSEGRGLATVYGIPGKTFDVSRAAFLNAAMVRFRDQDDTYLNEEYSHPDDNISPILAVAQQMGCSGADFIRGVAVAYEVHIALVGTGDGTGICLHKHKVDHMTHIVAGTVAGIGAMLNLPVEQIYQAVNFAVHNAVSSRQSREGEIGAQKEFVPGYAAEISIEAINNAMQGLVGPNPVYEGVDSLIRRFLNGKDDPNAEYKVCLPDAGEKFRNIMMSYPKEHAFEYQGQAIIDAVLEGIHELPAGPGDKPDFSQIEKIVLNTSHHTHHVIGTDKDDPAKIDPNSPRGTLDHSIMFAIGRTLQLGRFDEDVYDIPETEKPLLRELMAKVETRMDDEWTRKYKSVDPKVQAMGGELLFYVKGKDEPISIVKERANAHCYGATPWGREQYEGKFAKLTQGIVNPETAKKFFADAARLEQMDARELRNLTPAADLMTLQKPVKLGLYTQAALASAR